MYSFPIQNNVFEFEKMVFFQLLKNWVNSYGNWSRSMVVNHSSGLAEISGGNFSNWFEQFKNDISIIKPELNENGYCLPSLEIFENLIISISEDEEKIINCYSKFFKIELVGNEDRRKLKRKLKEYLFRKGTKKYPEFPQTILFIAHNSTNKYSEIQVIVTTLQKEIDTLMKS